MNDIRTLQQLLRDTAAELAREVPPPAVLVAVRAAFNQARPAPRRRWSGPLAWSGAAACAAVMLGSALLMLQPEKGSPEWARAGGFLPVASAERWADATKAGPAWLVSAELPNERLAELGLPYDASRAGERVQAELLLHPSGDVLAVRFLR